MLTPVTPSFTFDPSLAQEPKRLLSPAVREAPGITIGWVEHATLFFPVTDLSSSRLRIKAKVDTGANTSSLHAVDIEPFDRDGITFLSFAIPLNGVSKQVEAPLYKTGVVKTPEGVKQERFFIEAEICLGLTQMPILLSLNDRSTMIYPVLLGRTFLKERYLVDVSRKFLLEKPVCPLP